MDSEGVFGLAELVLGGDSALEFRLILPIVSDSAIDQFGSFFPKGFAFVIFFTFLKKAKQIIKIKKLIK